MRQIYETGSGSVKIRARYVYDKAQNCIDIIQIPYSTSIELIMKKLTEIIKEGKVKEIVDFRDEIDLSGFKLTLDLRRGVDPDKLMTKLFKVTPLEDAFKCNFNILIDSVPRQMGIAEILREWIVFRMGCVRRELTFDLNKKKEKLHLLEALAKVLLDIDLAIHIIRKTEKEADVIPSLMKGFDIDDIQANYIAEIKLRHLNREHILKRLADLEELEKKVQELEETLSSKSKVRRILVDRYRRRMARPEMDAAAAIEELDREAGSPDAGTILDAKWRLACHIAAERHVLEKSAISDQSREVSGFQRWMA
jgi:DNA gyrase subunit A